MERLLIHTPEGVRDIYGAELAWKRRTGKRLQQVFDCYGYQEIQTPAFEFFDVFSKEVGTTPSKDLYKFFDKEGNTLALRPDFTPSIARCAAKYFMEDPMPLFTSGKDDVEVGRIRKDYSVEHGLNFWLCGDQIRKGAALNAVQIAETLAARGLM